jgi:hypothetical protein
MNVRRSRPIIGVLNVADRHIAKFEKSTEDDEGESRGGYA